MTAVLRVHGGGTIDLEVGRWRAEPDHDETALLARLAEVRDILAENGTLFVEKNDGSVIQVAAQYGEDSPEYQSLGRKRKSERGTRRPRSSGNNTPNG